MRSWISPALPQQMWASINKGIVPLSVLVWLYVALWRVYGWNVRQPSSLLGFEQQRQKPFDLVLRNQICARLPSTSVHHSGIHSPQDFRFFQKTVHYTKGHTKADKFGFTFQGSCSGRIGNESIEDLKLHQRNLLNPGAWRKPWLQTNSHWSVKSTGQPSGTDSTTDFSLGRLKYRKKSWTL